MNNKKEPSEIRIQVTRISTTKIISIKRHNKKEVLENSIKYVMFAFSRVCVELNKVSFSVQRHRVKTFSFTHSHSQSPATCTLSSLSRPLEHETAVTRRPHCGTNDPGSTSGPGPGWSWSHRVSIRCPLPL